MLDMRINSPGQIMQTAGHEAAHVIVARRLGCDVASVQIGSQRESIAGFAEIDFSGADLVDQAAIKVAGDLWENLFGDPREIRDRGGPCSDLRWLIGHTDDFTRREASAIAVKILKSEKVPLLQLQHDLIRQHKVTFNTAPVPVAQRQHPTGRRADASRGRDTW